MSDYFASKNPLASVVVASNNSGKLAELRGMLAALPLEWFRASDVIGGPWSVVEDGDTFEKNALLKARAACHATGLIALADDSGLEVDALSGLPGVRSARFAHPHANDDENNAALLDALRGVSDADRTARFRCVLAVVTPYGHVPLLARGHCEGRIGWEQQGRGGFGYDPLFLVNRFDNRSMAELTSDEKSQVSHRGEAMRELQPLLIELILSMTCHLDSICEL
jgi:XTP/dITP diphosphohydrolase